MRIFVARLVLGTLALMVPAGCTTNAGLPAVPPRGGTVRFNVAGEQATVETTYLDPRHAANLICSLMRTGAIIIPLSIFLDDDSDFRAATDIVRLFDAPVPNKPPRETKTDAEFLQQILYGLSLGVNFRYGIGGGLIATPVGLDIEEAFARAEKQSGEELEKAFRASSCAKNLRVYAGLLAARAYTHAADRERAKRLYEGVIELIGDDTSLGRQKERAEDALAYVGRALEKRTPDE